MEALLARDAENDPFLQSLENLEPSSSRSSHDMMSHRIVYYDSSNSYTYVYYIYIYIYTYVDKYIYTFISLSLSIYIYTIIQYNIA